MGQYTCEKILFELAENIQHLQPVLPTPHMKHLTWSICNGAQLSTVRRYTSLLSRETICNLRTMGKTMRYSSPIASINGMDLYKVGIEVHLIRPEVHLTHLVHPHLVLHLSQGHFNIPRSVLYIEKSAVGQLIILNRSVITQKSSLVTVTPNLRTDQVINRTYNAGSSSMKV